MLYSQDLSRLEEETLATYAMKSSATRGRDYPLTPDRWRTEFQRDRDRIIHSAAFRKLEYKTQVYIVHFGDYYRTRITHTMEVAQIARTLARNLQLNADLTEAIALAHDLGHMPFGHSGEATLQRLLKEDGGFEHNEQGLRVVEVLEERYPDIQGLNLTWEVREGIIKHASDYDKPTIPERFLPNQSPTLESQLCDVADEIAYNSHDLDDALKMGLIEEQDLEEVDWVWSLVQEIRSITSARQPEKFVKYRVIGRVIDRMVADVLHTTENNLNRLNIASVHDVKQCPGRIVGFSPDQSMRNRRLKDFLLKKVYYHPSVVRMNTKAEYFVERLFNLYVRIPGQLPLKYQNRISTEGIKRVVTDYLCGMTDRYLTEDYIRAFEPNNIRY